MRSNRKISDEARHDVAVIAGPPSHQGNHHAGKKMVGGLGLHMRREVLKQMSPRYREASVAQKRQLLDDFTHLTGYHRRYAMWLLKHHVGQGQHPCVQVRPRRYALEVEEVLVQVWKQTNRVCSKRLIPFLPTAIEAMERHDHLHLTPDCRTRLLSMSASTADRLLRPHRQQELRGLCTTRAGTLLKSTIPIRTFEQWDEQVPGFVEADLVAHCDSSVEGTYLFTLTMTDIATGWTECLPLLTKSAEAVLAAVQQARSLFPFSLLSLDTDNGTEFINDLLVSYCEAEQITFTRGRPALKNDQCYVEQKNGHLVRQVVGYVGEPAFACLNDLYRVLSQYVNFFQPSMKLCAKFKEGKKVRRIYDEAKTPLMRLLQAEVLPTEQKCDLTKRFETLDPVRLLEQAQQAQQVLFLGAVSIFAQSEKRRRLCGSERFRVVGRPLLPSAADALSRMEPEPGTGREEEGPSGTTTLLEWHRTRNDPFQEQWEVIAKWVRADPTRSCRAMFEELRRLFPDRYQPSHLRTLQRGVCKIRARLARVSVKSQRDVPHVTVSPILVSEEQEQQDEVNEHEGSAIPSSYGEVPAHDPSLPSSLGSQEEPLSEHAPLKPSTRNEEQMPETSLVSDTLPEPTRSGKNPMSTTI